jgi:8-oxo-dGTP diphosphatase
MRRARSGARPGIPSTAESCATGCPELRTFYVVRHAKAGDPEKWTGDDRLRPLTKKGRKQAEELVTVYKPFRVSDIYSSDYLRCVETVEPLAASRRLDLKRSPSLEFGSGLEGLTEFLGDRSLDDVVLSTHGDIVFELVEDLVGREVVKAGEGGYQKASTWVLEVDDHGVTERARYIAAP